MLFRLFVLFTIVPLVELALLIKIGEHIGTSNTIALVLLTGFAGAYLARDQGLRVVREFTDSVQRGDMPADPLLEGLLIVIGGAFLVTPGIITDVVGFLLVVPQTRRVIRGFLAGFIKANVVVSSFSQGSVHFRSSGTHRKRDDDDDDIIDV